MKILLRASSLLIALLAAFAGSRSDAQSAAALHLSTLPGIDAPQDRPYPGRIELQVDARDIEQHILHVHERLNGVSPRTALLYPRWLPGMHSPAGKIDRLGGLSISTAGAPVRWTRDPLNVFAFHLDVPTKASSLDIEFDYLSPPTGPAGELEISHNLEMIEWSELLLYPAGYFVRQIPVQASLMLPADWSYGTALIAHPSVSLIEFDTVDVETLVDSPVYAGRYSARLDLDPGSATPVHLDMFAEHPESLTVSPAQLSVLRALVSQAYKLFGPPHYAHYDFLYLLSDQVQSVGLEHLQSSEVQADPDTFSNWDSLESFDDTLAHEFSHAWNGKYRRPADLWTPNYDVPMQNTLLWLYEGQTEYWGEILMARSGRRTREQALEQFANDAAYYASVAGRHWRSLQDTTSTDIMITQHYKSPAWPSWQRAEDYYSEGALIWLEADTLIRERSHGTRSLDDFARLFFAAHGKDRISTYVFKDIVDALNQVEPYDWAIFLNQWIDSVPAPLLTDTLAHSGYRLVYTDTPSAYFKNVDEQTKRHTLLYSIGVTLDAKDSPGTITEILWDSPAFNARLSPGAQIVAVNGVAYSAQVIDEAIRSARRASTPIQLIVKTADRFDVVTLDYHQGLRYPHLERDASQPARLDDILAAKP